MLEQNSQQNNIDLKALKKKIFRFFGAALIVMAVFLFLASGTFDYWQAWVYIAILFIPMLFVVGYFLKKDPAFLARRMHAREKEPEQKLLQLAGVAIFIAFFVIPGLDKRFAWSSVPAAIVIISDVIVLSGYLFVFYVFRINSYASRIIEVEKDQKVISTGPYAVIRHPMYLGVLMMYLPTPLALGSYWGLIPSSLLIPFIYFRIKNEEKLLIEKLEGYKEYRDMVKYRLIPKVW